MATAANASTIAVEINVSRREGQVTFAVSARTCCRKVKGFVVFDAISRSAQAPDGSVINTLPQSRDLLQAAF